MPNRIALLALGVAAMAACDRPSNPVVPQAEPSANRVGHHEGRIKHVLLISVDGLHALDLRRYVATHPTSTLAGLSRHGVTFSNVSTSKPSDSWPGILAITTGGSPRSTGIIYEVSHDRSLSPPGDLACDTIGTKVDYSEFVDINVSQLDGGGGIDPNKLPRDPQHGCAPVFPHSYLRVNTIFEVAKKAGFRTAWSDKSLGYEVVNGPSGHGVDDDYNPEISAPLPNGQTPTTNVSDVEQYDSIKVQAILNEIDGHDHTGQGSFGTPGIFGMNFQTVSVGQKTAGYLDAAGTPSVGLAGALDFVDVRLGRFVSELEKRGLLESTLIVVSAKHGQAPIDPAQRHIIGSALVPNIVNGVQPGLLSQTTEDDLAILWLTDHSQTEAVVDALQANRAALGISTILSGDRLEDGFNSVRRDPRAPDAIVLVQQGVIYASPTASKLSEHGGFGHDDTNVPILLSAPGIRAEDRDDPVTTAQIAPTILEALGLNPGDLQAVQQEGTRTLPIDFDIR
jgi:hypothetical protein